MTLWLIAGHFGHALAAVLFASLAILISRRPERMPAAPVLVVALALTALWSLRHVFVGFSPLGQFSDGVTETMRNAAWLAVLAAYLGWLGGLGGPSEDGRRDRPRVLLALSLVLLVQILLDLLIGTSTPVSAQSLPLFKANWMLRCAFALGALFVLHRMTRRRDDPAAARRQAWVGVALACMWAYDFNHYVLAWFLDGQVTLVGPLRGFVMALLATMLVLGLRSDGTRAFALSRPAVTRLVSGGVIGFYLLVVVVLVALSREFDEPVARIVQFSLLFALAVAVLALLPSASFRSWLRMEVSRHVFALRYDYRALWLKFAATMDEAKHGAAPVDARVVRAIAQALDAPAGLLYLCEADGRLAPASRYAWPEDVAEPADLSPAFRDEIARTGWIVDLTRDWPRFGAMLPSWMQRSRHAWVIAPLIHREQLVGAVLLAGPSGGRALDWEDLDVLRVVCGEAAARIAEERNRAALAEAQRFDEFNRRFAFILHDLKNLVSQMTLLASNARRHADNPAFRADMVLTLEETAGRMSELLQRLGRPGLSAQAEPVALPLGSWVRTLAQAWAGGAGMVAVEGDVARPVLADAQALDRALGHLVRNAIEASPAGSTVHIRIEEAETDARLHVIDAGTGMSAAFIRERLFRPFHSTKPHGFGLGAHEARLLVEAMGGGLSVASVEGQGSCFTIRLPFAGRNVDVAHAEVHAHIRKAG